MHVVCPDCRLDCTIDELSTETFSCPSCGLLLFSRSGDSAHPVGALAVASVNEVSLEATRQWQPEGANVLDRLHPLPQKLGRYQLNELLGRGSFGLVFRAFDSQLGREVAIKIPHRHRFESSEGLSKFLDEARTVARIEHPGIVRIYDVGWLTDDLCFISMELCPSGTLETLVAQGPLPPARATQIMTEIAEAVHFAHLQGFVHRDLKPSNIMFGRDGRPRVVDFGLALTNELQLQTDDGVVAGTLPYMSPEQVRGETQFFDGRTDIWSLGVIFYQLLTGQRPFQGTKRQLARQICDRPPKPLRQIDDSIPESLEVTCLRCLEKEVTNRWATAMDFANALRQWLAANDSIECAPSVCVPQEKRQKLKITVISPLVLALAVLSIGGSLAFTLKPTKNGTPSEPVKLSRLNPLDEVPLGRTISLIDEGRVPQKLLWPTPGIDDSFSYDLSSAVLTLQNRSSGFVELGSTTADEIVLEADFSRTPGRGSNGFFFGWQPHPTQPTWQDCFAVMITSTIDRTGQLKHHVSVELLRFRPDRNGRTLCAEVAGLSGQELEPGLHPDRGRLAIRVSNSRGLLAIHWEGRELVKLPKEAHSFLKSQPQRFPFMRSAGRFGILNRSGGLLVRNPSIRIERRASNPVRLKTS
jgi:serine/threonine protein kinase